ncbi:MAG: flagellar hook protein FlgE [Burkholderiales bacterium]|nr:flagellar hook protein FlgE [Burkholderiales bacterium]
MSFQQGLSGLNAAAKHLDVIGNNVANANTAGFKGSLAQFGDVFASRVGGGGTQIGIGTSITAVLPLFGQGNITVSANPLDLAINGQGFFRVSAGGTVTYTRNGQFSLDKEGYIVNAAGARLTGYPATAAGTIVASTPTELRISSADLAPAATQNAKIVLNLDSRNGTLPAAGFNLADPTTYHSATSLAVYDSLGNPHTLTAYFVKTAPNVWSVFAAANGVQVGAGAVGTLAFQPDGTIDTAASGLPFALAVPVGTGAASPLAFALDFSGSTQFGSNFGVNELVQDGYPSGKLTGYAISSDGTIIGRYSNGQTRAQGQVVLANFTNPQGLQPLGNNQWGETAASGQPLVGAPNTGNLGVIQSGALEESNVDITEELVRMITAQRIYQANAQTIKTQDAVLQTMVNLR